MTVKGAISRWWSFLLEVRRELDKISWPSRKEVMMTTVVVFVLAVVAALFFSIVDTASYNIVHFIIGR
ncbi:MAG: preprotein translocase subunit SecE [Holosporales bacterium]|jgi:preprotein translocase subunit SecE|nr:preprotein translocase subunit SecE [Holosporales bacterium]